jgi:hypothetical protein
MEKMGIIKKKNEPTSPDGMWAPTLARAKPCDIHCKCCLVPRSNVQANTLSAEVQLMDD